MFVRRYVTLVALALALVGFGFGAAAVAADGSEFVAEGRTDVARGDLETGLAAMRGRDWTAARVYLQRAVDRDPQDPDALAAMGETYLRLGDRESAYQYIEAALIVEPENRRALATMGEISLASGNVAEARRRAGQLAEQCPRGCAERNRLEEAIVTKTGAQGGS
jgi:Tfp pilus assembly protein PilF